MILAVDPGYAKCGWAVVEPTTGRFIALGVIVTTQDPGVKRKTVKQSTDRARRITEVSKRLAQIARAPHITAIAAEQALGHGAPAAVAANLLPWGAVAAIAAVCDLELLELPAKLWQRRILGDVEGSKPKSKRDYGAVKAALKSYADTQIEHALAAVDSKDETHALDAAGVGLVVAIDRLDATIINRRNAA